MNFLTFVLLLGATLFSSVVSGVMGMGGGIILLTVMALFLTPTLLIPVHGVIQFSSNLSRALMHTKDIVWPIVIPFVVGAAPGAYLAGKLVIDIPEREFQMGLALFILLATWLPKIKKAPKIRGKFFILGFSATFVSVFVGATGPLIAPFYLREGLVKERLIATKATCQLFLHLFKVSVYILIGFQLGSNAVWVLPLVAAVVLGNWIGKKLLKYIPDDAYVLGLKLLISAMAGLMFAKAFLLT